VGIEYGGVGLVGEQCEETACGKAKVFFLGFCAASGALISRSIPLSASYLLFSNEADASLALAELGPNS
jgi:hypothetical protein